MNIYKKDKEGPHGHQFVTITVDNVEYEIHRGHQTVVEIKNLAGVSLADELNQIVEGEVVKLPDDGSVVIKGGEVFVSQPASGGAA